MLSSAAWIPAALAVVLAVLAAGCSATAAFLQQGSLTRVPAEQGTTAAGAPGRVGLRSRRRLAGQPRWLGGWGLIGTGALLHVSSLLLAPIAVVQPIGILAVPVGVIWRPTQSVPACPAHGRRHRVGDGGDRHLRRPRQRRRDSDRHPDDLERCAHRPGGGRRHRRGTGDHRATSLEAGPLSRLRGDQRSQLRVRLRAHPRDLPHLGCGR